MKFVLPDQPTDLVAELMATASLKDIQVSTLQNIAALAARKIRDWQNFGADLMRELDELETVKVSAMASDRLVIEQQQKVAQALRSVRDRLDILMAPDAEETHQ
jgi:hypothetical protein